MRTISEAIKSLREEKNLTQAQLASKAGVAKSTLSEIESDMHGTTAKTAKRIFKVLV